MLRSRSESERGHKGLRRYHSSPQGILPSMEEDAPENGQAARDAPLRGYKCRINQLFRPEDVEKIDNAVKFVHAVMCNATLLVMYRLVKLATAPGVDVSRPPMVVNETEYMRAVRAVTCLPPERKPEKKRKTEGPAEEDEAAPKTQTNSTRARARKVQPRKAAEDTGAPPEDPEETAQRQAALDAARDDRQAHNDAWSSDYAEMTSKCPRPPDLPKRGDDLSVSGVLTAAAKQCCVSQLTNIRYHYRQYVCRAFGIVLRNRVCSFRRVRTFSDIPSAEGKRWRQEFGRAYDDVLQHRHGDDMRACDLLAPLVEKHRYRLVPPLPQGKRSIDSDLSGTVRPYVYLGYMIRLSKFMESCGLRGKALLSPVPTKTSFIPAHYAFDTACISHLLMDSKRIKGFRGYMADSHKINLPGLEDKASLCASLSTQMEREATPRDEELYMDGLWTYLAHFRNRRTRVLNPLVCARATHPGAMRFDHSISTDGYSVTMMATDKETRARKHMYRPAVTAKKGGISRRVVPGRPAHTDACGFLNLSHHSAETVREQLTALGNANAEEFLGGDPGKGVLLELCNQDRQVLRYTSSQRRHETGVARNARRLGRLTNLPWTAEKVVKLPDKRGVATSMGRPTVRKLER